MENPGPAHGMTTWVFPVEDLAQRVWSLLVPVSPMDSNVWSFPHHASAENNTGARKAPNSRAVAPHRGTGFNVELNLARCHRIAAKNAENICEN